ncbi:hypothetical protein BJ322DRAFT_1090970 [Thelephora terrestris]|uniref:Secreted protein n=1 Tax=Thelephora terrestris TaxID=56493 RepID=A0A9P6H4X5_9AGAM|nr:hypothetical protein BJ322DRAFT_1090970 [Thelephora terrestris]
MSPAPSVSLLSTSNGLVTFWVWLDLFHGCTCVRDWQPQGAPPIRTVEQEAFFGVGKSTNGPMRPRLQQPPGFDLFFGASSRTQPPHKSNLEHWNSGPKMVYLRRVIRNMKNAGRLSDILHYRTYGRSYHCGCVKRRKEPSVSGSLRTHFFPRHAWTFQSPTTEG